MAEHQGYIDEWARDTLSEKIRFHDRQGGGWIVDLKSHGGNYSLCVAPGCSFDIWYGCDAGEKTTSVYCWKPSGASAALEIFDPDSGETIARTEATLSEQWEKLEASFKAEKKVYMIRLKNSSIWWGVGRVYFDDLE